MYLMVGDNPRLPVFRQSAASPKESIPVKKSLACSLLVSASLLFCSGVAADVTFQQGRNLECNASTGGPPSWSAFRRHWRCSAGTPSYLEVATQTAGAPGNGSPDLENYTTPEGQPITWAPANGNLLWLRYNIRCPYTMSDENYNTACEYPYWNPSTTNLPGTTSRPTAPATTPTVTPTRTTAPTGGTVTATVTPRPTVPPQTCGCMGGGAFGLPWQWYAVRYDCSCSGGKLVVTGYSASGEGRTPSPLSSITTWAPLGAPVTMDNVTCPPTQLPSSACAVDNTARPMRPVWTPTRGGSVPAESTERSSLGGNSTDTAYVSASPAPAPSYDGGTYIAASPAPSPSSYINYYSKPSGLTSY